MHTTLAYRNGSARGKFVRFEQICIAAAELRQLATQIVMLKRGRVTALGGVKVLT
jgi:hypothetical protein